MKAAKSSRPPPRLFARLMLPFGIVMVLLSLWTISIQAPGSAERIISVINIVIGAILIGIGFYLSLMEGSNKVS